jgi:hypothetical protein
VKEQILALRAEGLSFGLIARRLGVTRNVVAGCCQRNAPRQKQPVECVRPSRATANVRRPPRAVKQIAKADDRMPKVEWKPGRILMLCGWT